MNDDDLKSYEVRAKSGDPTLGPFGPKLVLDLAAEVRRLRRLLAEDGSHATKPEPAEPKPGPEVQGRMCCTCNLGAHPPARNLLSGAAERGGYTCRLGWPINGRCPAFGKRATYPDCPDCPLCKPGLK